MSLFDDIRAELGNPNIYQVSREQFEEMESDARGKPYKIGASWGISSNYFPHLYVAPGMSQKRRKNTYYHEFLHLLYPHWPHWRVVLTARRLAGGGHGEEADGLYGHELSEIPPRDVLLKRIRKASQRFNEKTTTRRKK